MKLVQTNLKGHCLVKLKPKEDLRGLFVRNYCKKEFSSFKLNTKWVQINSSISYKSKTLRGLHFQTPPYQEIKLVRCINGSIFDVVVDLRKNSRTYKKWFGAILSNINCLMMYVPKGFAHGFLSLEDKTEVMYLSSEFYKPKHEKVLSWDDPDLKISWPKKPKIISKKDTLALKFKDLEKFL